MRNLKYQGPTLLRQAVENVRADSRHPIDVIDAGCGTGLCAELFRPLARRLDGIDLSPRMIEKFREKGLYDRLITAEICDALQSMGARYDLVLAADFLIYIGELPPLIDAVAKVLRRGGLFAFTAEIGEDPGYSLTSTGRYAHNARYIEDEATRAGFGVARRDDATLRFEEGQPVPCLIYVLVKG